MTADDAADFHRVLAAVLETYAARLPGDAVLRLWWAALERYPWAAVREALAEHVARCKFAPRPADIRERIEARDGRPSPDEAWSLALAARDEAGSLVWTEEIAAAWGVALPILAAGDLIGARKAFLAAYGLRLEQARERLEPARWRASLGTDPAQRADALREAEQRGRLSSAQVRRLLPGIDQAAPAAAHALAAVLVPASAARRDADADRAGPVERSIPPPRAQAQPAVPRANADTQRLLDAVRAGLAQGRAQRERARTQAQARRQRQEVERAERRRAQRQWLSGQPPGRLPHA